MDIQRLKHIFSGKTTVPAFEQIWRFGESNVRCQVLFGCKPMQLPLKARRAFYVAMDKYFEAKQIMQEIYIEDMLRIERIL